MQRHLTAIGLAIAALVLLLGVLLQRDNPDLLRWEVEGDTAYGYGFTDGRSIGSVRDLVRAHPSVDRLVLRDMPGTRDVVSNDRLAREIRRASLDTHLEADSFVASGAVSLFIAGVERTAECGARVGVHAWGSAGVDAQTALMDNLRGFLRDFLSDMGVDPDFYDFTARAAPASGLHIMTPQELETWGLVSEPMDCA